MCHLKAIISSTIVVILLSLGEHVYAAECKDTIDCSDYVVPDACHGAYSAWAHGHCPVHCGFCPGNPTPPGPCVDTIGNCNEYQDDICTNPSFLKWRKTHCKKFCKLC